MNSEQQKQIQRDFDPTKKFKPRYDRHRRIKNRRLMGGVYWCGSWLPHRKVTWGEHFAARLESEYWRDFIFANAD